MVSQQESIYKLSKDLVTAVYHKIRPPKISTVTETATDSGFPTYDLTQLPNYTTAANIVNSIFNGEKFYGGFGNTQLQVIDYYELRNKSAQLFNENLYAKGLIRRLITNEVNTGLMPELNPDSDLLGIDQNDLDDWADNTETRFNIYGKNPDIIDFEGLRTWGKIQREAKLEAYIEGDILVVLRINPKTQLPAVQLIRGSAVKTPLLSTYKIPKGHKVVHGVELDNKKRHVAFWVVQEDGTYKRIPARGLRSSRKQAWLVYGTEKRTDDVRGVPLLSIIAQSLKELDRYRDAVQRKAVINSIIALFVTKDNNKPGSLPLGGGAVRRDQATVVDSGSNNNGARNFNLNSFIPGVVIDELQEGEEPKSFGNEGTDLKLGDFEEVVIQSIAWANEIPPEILRLAFTDNYSASQAAINEFKIYLRKVWMDWGECFCAPIFREWLLSEVLLNRILAPGLLESYIDPNKYEIYGAWTQMDWYGTVKPTTDLVKQAKGSKLAVDEGWTTNAKESRELSGTKYTNNIRRLKRENKLKAEAMAPIIEMMEKLKTSNNNNVNDNTVEEFNNTMHELLDKLDKVG